MIDCYTDASYAKDVGGSVIGYKIGDLDIQTKFLEGVKNTEAEIMAVRECVRLCQELYPGSTINIHTDCQKALQLDFGTGVVLHKMVGHMKNSLKDDKQLIFTQVDRLARKKLRQRRKRCRKN